MRKVTKRKEVSHMQKTLRDIVDKEIKDWLNVVTFVDFYAAIESHVIGQQELKNILLIKNCNNSRKVKDVL